MASLRLETLRLESFCQQIDPQIQHAEVSEEYCDVDDVGCVDRVGPTGLDEAA